MFLPIAYLCVQTLQTPSCVQTLWTPSCVQTVWAPSSYYKAVGLLEHGMKVVEMVWGKDLVD